MGGRREDTTAIHSFIPLIIEHHVPSPMLAAGCFEWKEVWSRLSSKLLGCFQVAA